MEDVGKLLKVRGAVCLLDGWSGVPEMGGHVGRVDFSSITSIFSNLTQKHPQTANTGPVFRPDGGNAPGERHSHLQKRRRPHPCGGEGPDGLLRRRHGLRVRLLACWLAWVARLLAWLFMLLALWTGTNGW